MERVSEEVARFLNACKDGSLGTVESMLNARKEIANERDASGRAGLHFAAFFGKVDIIQLLVNFNADLHLLDYDNMSPLMLAAKKGEQAAVLTLLKCKADVNQGATDSKITAAHHAAAIGDVPMLELLVKNGATFNFEPTEKGSPLHWAATSGTIDPVAYFLDFHGAPLMALDSNGGTIVHAAVTFGHVDLVLFLLERQADPNIQARGGCTALHLATEISDKLEIVQHLLTFGAKNIADEAGDTPLAMAKARGKKSFVKELQKLESGGFEIPMEKRLENMERFKAQGNKVFQAGENSKSCKFYTLAIAFNPKNHVLFSNRSAALYNLRRLPLALADACQCIRLKPDWPKGYFRKGSALMLMGQYDDAKTALLEGLKYDAANSDIKSALKVLDDRVAKSQVK